MTVFIENPFAGFEVGWTWAEHVKAGYQGGTDYIFYPSDGDIVAAADGKITLQAGTNGFTPGPAIILTLADGRTINYREVATPLVKNGQMVTRGQAIGVPNKASRWPHIDATVGGVRVPFEPLVNIGLDPSGGGGTPVPVPTDFGDPDMPTQWRRTDGTLTTYVLFDGEHWEEYTEASAPGRANFDAALYNDPAKNFAAWDITGNALQIAAWNYRSNNRPDLKIPFGTSPAAFTTAQLTTIGTTLAAGLKLPAGSTPAQVQAVQDAVTALQAEVTALPSAGLTAATTVALLGAKTSA